MELGKGREAALRLLEAGYADYRMAFKLALRYGQDKMSVAELFPLENGKQYAELDFSFRDGKVHLENCSAYLLLVPLEHGTYNGVDTQSLEERMKSVDWSKVRGAETYGFSPPRDVPADYRFRNEIFEDLTRLHWANDPKAEELAAGLTVKYWAWTPKNDYSTYVEELKQERVIFKDFPDLISVTEANRQLSFLWEEKEIIRQGFSPEKQTELLNQLNDKRMNLNNLEDLQNEVKMMGFNPALADQLEKHMKDLPGYFTLKDQVPGTVGVVDLTLHFKKSGQSDTYNFGKFEAKSSLVPPLPEGQKFMVISENKEQPEKPLVKTFENPAEAIDFFKKLKVTSELAIGDGMDGRSVVASKENGNVNYIRKDFNEAYKTPAIKQMFYPEDGVGFNAVQAANLVQQRAVFRDDLMTRLGDPYQAWMKLDLSTKDAEKNFKFSSWNVPAYGFDLEKTLERYQIKELADPQKKAELIKSLENGNRAEITTNYEGKEVKMLIEAAPRYININVFNENGKSEKRELFEKKLDNDLFAGKSKKQERSEGKSKGI